MITVRAVSMTRRVGARADAKTDTDNARADLVLALADLTKGDPTYQMVRDIIARVDYLLTRLRD